MSSNIRPSVATPIFADDFNASQWEPGKRTAADYFGWWDYFSTQGLEANSRAELSKSALSWTLADACSMRLEPSSTNEPLRPTEADEYQRPRNVASFEERVELFSEIYPLIGEPRLRARLADICWLARRPRRRPEDALAAIDAYAQVHLDADTWFLHDGKECWRRAITLARQLRAAGESRVVALEHKLKQSVELDLAPGSESDAAVSKAEVLLEHGLAGPEYEHLAELLYTRGQRLRDAKRFFHSRHPLHCARQFFAAAKNPGRAADMALAVAAAFVDEAAARSSGPHARYAVAVEFYTNAFQELRTIPKPLRAERNVDGELSRIYGLLREAGARSLDEFPEVPGELLDFTEEARESMSQVENKELLEALLTLAGCCRYVSHAQLEMQAKEQVSKEFMARAFSSSHIAADGRTIHRTPAADTDSKDEDAKAALTTVMVQLNQTRLRLNVVAGIAPILEQLTFEHHVDEEDLRNICLMSPVVQNSRAWLVAKGLKAGFDNDFCTALHLLVPQLEHIVRTHVTRRGARTVTVGENGVLMEMGLSSLVAMEEMTAAFGPDFSFEVQALFCEQSGPNLRNDFAHGLLEPGATVSAESIYAWWLVFKLVFTNYWHTVDGEFRAKQPSADATSEV